jgi:hypothetical protein
MLTPLPVAWNLIFFPIWKETDTRSMSLRTLYPTHSFPPPNTVTGS